MISTLCWQIWPLYKSGRRNWKVLVWGCDGMNREEKSPVSFVLFVQSMLITSKRSGTKACFHRWAHRKCPKERQCGKAQEVRHARQGCKYGATTNPDDQLYLDFHSARKSVRVCNDGWVDSRRQIIRRRLHACWPRRKCPSHQGKKKCYATEPSRVANQLRLRIAILLAMQFLKSKSYPDLCGSNVDWITQFNKDVYCKSNNYIS